MPKVAFVDAVDSFLEHLRETTEFVIKYAELLDWTKVPEGFLLQFGGTSIFVDAQDMVHTAIRYTFFHVSGLFASLDRVLARSEKAHGSNS